MSTFSYKQIPGLDGCNGDDDPPSAGLRTRRASFVSRGKTVFAWMGLLIASVTVLAQEPPKATPLEWAVRIADSEIGRLGDSLAWRPGAKAKWNYTTGLLALSLLKLGEHSNHERYTSFSCDTIASFVTKDGDIRTYQPENLQLDDLNSGRMVLALWRTTHDVRYRRAAATLRNQLEVQPRTASGGFWHMKKFPNQMWLDGLYMAEPFYAEYTRELGVTNTHFDDIARQFSLINIHTFDPQSGLNFHGWDEIKVQPWANPLTGCSSNFWGRAIGWYAMALVDVLDDFPTNHPARAQILADFQRLAVGIVKWQDAKTGLWWQVMDQGSRRGNYLEASASAIFVYALAKGVNRGYLPRQFATAAENGYAGIVKNLIKSDGQDRWSITHCCSVARLGGTSGSVSPRDGSFDYYAREPIVDNDLKAIGPFILASIELQPLSQEKF
jgi:unsaturated rhamnogalacturonyl hydrolase